MNDNLEIRRAVYVSLEARNRLDLASKHVSVNFCTPGKSSFRGD